MTMMGTAHCIPMMEYGIREYGIREKAYSARYVSPEKSSGKISQLARCSFPSRSATCCSIFIGSNSHEVSQS